MVVFHQALQLSLRGALDDLVVGHIEAPILVLVEHLDLVFTLLDHPGGVFFENDFQDAGEVVRKL